MSRCSERAPTEPRGRVEQHLWAAKKRQACWALPASVPCVAPSPMQPQRMPLAPSRRAQDREPQQVHQALQPDPLRILFQVLTNTFPWQEVASPMRCHTESPGELFTNTVAQNREEALQVAPGGGDAQLGTVHKKVPPLSSHSQHREALCRAGAGHPTVRDSLLLVVGTTARRLQGPEPDLEPTRLSFSPTWESTFHLPRTPSPMSAVPSWQEASLLATDFWVPNGRSLNPRPWR